MQTDRTTETPDRAATEDRVAEPAPLAPAAPGRALNHANVLALQRSAGNHATTAMLARDGPIAAPPKAPPDDQKLSQLRDIALLAINTYEDGAADGILDAKGTLSSMSGWGPFVTALAGNVIWAAACFSTGGTAFAISLVGIGVGMSPSIPKNGEDFAAWAKASVIKEIRQRLESKVDSATKDTLAKLGTDGWDDNKVRSEILAQLFKPEFVKVIAGGIPMADRAAIAHRIHADILVRANRQVADPNPMQNPGYVHYNYKVSGHRPPGYQFGDDLAPVESWKFALTGGELTMEEGGATAVAELKKDPKLKPAEMPFIKVIHLTDDDGGLLVLTIDGKNAYFKKFSNVVFQRPDPQAVVKAVWSDSAGLPPEIETSKLK